MSELFNCEKWQFKAKDAIPCPFCGSKSISVKHKEVKFYGWNGLGWKKHRMKAYCVCNKCGATGTPIYYDGYSNAPFEYYDDEHKRVYSCGEEAIKAWNTRKPMDKIVERLEAMKMRYFLTIANTGDEKLDAVYEEVGNAIDKAIEIIKEEGQI